MSCQRSFGYITTVVPHRWMTLHALQRSQSLQLSPNFHFVFILIVCHVDLPPLWILIGLVSKFTTLVTLANTWLSIWNLFALCSEGWHRHWVCCKGVSCLMGWRSIARCGTLLSSCIAGCFSVTLLKDETLFCNLSIFMALLWASSTENTS